MRSLWQRITRRQSRVDTLEQVNGADLDLRFIGEQSGKVEDTLKTALEAVLRERRTVLRAYLAKVQYGGAASASVALCLRFNSPYVDEDTIGTAAGVFRGMFGTTQMLDIVPLNDRQETALTKVCRPFYMR